MSSSEESVRAPVLLVARALAVAPPGVHAPILDLSLTLEPATWLAITGPNGAGKTSLALTLAGLWPARSGGVTFSGGRRRFRPPHGISTAAPLDEPLRPRVIVILQEPATQLTQRTVAEEIAFTAINLGISAAAATERASAWARRCGIEPLLDRAPHQLSAGQQQLVLIAAALAAAPEILIADEASAHLDPEARHRVLEILESQVRAGLSLLWVSQDPEEIRWADRVIELSMDGSYREFSPAPTSTPVFPGAVQGLAPPDEVPRAPAHHDPPAAEDAIAGAARGTVRVRLRVHPASGSVARVACGAAWELAIGARGIWALTGPNGSGKSSVLEALAGLVSIPQVEVEWQRQPACGPLLVGQYPERQIFAERVGDELAFAAVRRGRAKADVLEDARDQLAQLGLAVELLERRTWELSSGEKRLVALLGAFLAPAEIVLLDEPTCGLDLERRGALARRVRELGSRVGVVIASQDRAWLEEVGVIEVPLGIYDGPDSSTRCSKRQVSAKKRIDRSV